MEAATRTTDRKKWDESLLRAQRRIMALQTEEQERQEAEDKEVIALVRTNYEQWKAAHPVEARQAVPLTIGTVADMPDEMVDDLPDTYAMAQRQFKRGLAAGVRVLVGAACLVLAQQELMEPVAAAICAGCWWLSAAESWARSRA